MIFFASFWVCKESSQKQYFDLLNLYPKNIDLQIYLVENIEISVQTQPV